MKVFCNNILWSDSYLTSLTNIALHKLNLKNMILLIKKAKEFIAVRVITYHDSYDIENSKLSSSNLTFTES